MRVAVDELVPVPEPQMSVRHEQTLAMFLRPGSIELGFRRSEMARLAYGAGEMFLCHRHAKRWVRADDEPHILATGWENSPFQAAHERAKAKGWKTRTVTCGHEVMLDHPGELTDLLLEFVTPAVP